jgi:hypothetical protein
MPQPMGLKPGEHSVKSACMPEVRRRATGGLVDTEAEERRKYYGKDARLAHKNLQRAMMNIIALILLAFSAFAFVRRSGSNGDDGEPRLLLI